MAQMLGLGEEDDAASQDPRQAAFAPSSNRAKQPVPEAEQASQMMSTTAVGALLPVAIPPPVMVFEPPPPPPIQRPEKDTDPPPSSDGVRADRRHPQVEQAPQAVDAPPISPLLAATVRQSELPFGQVAGRVPIQNSKVEQTTSASTESGPFGALGSDTSKIAPQMARALEAVSSESHAAASSESASHPTESEATEPQDDPPQPIPATLSASLMPPFDITPSGGHQLMQPSTPEKLKISGNGEDRPTPAPDATRSSNHMANNGPVEKLVHSARSAKPAPPEQHVFAVQVDKPAAGLPLTPSPEGTEDLRILRDQSPREPDPRVHPIQTLDQPESPAPSDVPHGGVEAERTEKLEFKSLDHPKTEVPLLAQNLAIDVASAPPERPNDVRESAPDPWAQIDTLAPGDIEEQSAGDVAQPLKSIELSIPATEKVSVRLIDSPSGPEVQVATGDQEIRHHLLGSIDELATRVQDLSIGTVLEESGQAKPDTGDTSDRRERQPERRPRQRRSEMKFSLPGVSSAEALPQP